MSYQITFPSNGCAVVFGGSGGCGSVICETLAKAGSPVAFSYLRGLSRAELTLQKIRSHGVLASAHSVDGRDADAVTSFINSAAVAFGGIHSVIYAAGPTIEFVPISQTPTADALQVISADIGCFLALLKASSPYLRASKGSLTSCVTFANHRVMDFDGLSATPKAAIESLIRQFAAEEGGNGVRANSVGLGWIDAGVGAVSEGTDYSLVASLGVSAQDQLRQKIRLGRPGTGQEIANTVVFLASDQASYITGQTVLVDGGLAL